MLSILAIKLLCLTAISSSIRLLKTNNDWTNALTHKVFSTNCTMTVNAAKREIYLQTAEGPMTMTEGGIIKDGINIGPAPPRALICEAVDTHAKNGSIAILDTATSTTYLYHGGENQWSGFINKHCYAKLHNKGHFLWIGEVTSEATELLLKKDQDAVPCKDGTPSNHYFRPLALQAILEAKPHVGRIINMDLDVWIPAAHWNDDLETQFFAESEDVITGQSSGPRLVSGACVGFKNSLVGKQVLAGWFKNRCGRKDQIALWNSLFQAFQREDPNFKFDAGKMSSYKTAMKYSIELARRHWPDYGGKPSYRNGWTVEKPVHMGKTLLVHPNAKGSKALLYAIGGSYVCHASSKTPARVNADTKCAFEHVCEKPEQCQCV